MPKISLTARLLAAGLICCVLDGAVRKWVLFNAPYVLQAIPYFAKDAFILMAAIAGALAAAPAPRLGPFRTMLFISVAIVAAGILPNLGDTRLIGGMVSLRTMIVYPVLAVPIAQGIRSPRDVLFLVKVVGWMAMMNAFLGAVQFYLPSGHILNQQISADLQAHTVGLDELSRIRAMGTFSFISGMGDLAVAGAWAGCVLLLLHPRHWLGYAFLAAGFVCAFAAMSRYGFFLASVVAVGALVVSGRRPGLVLTVVCAGAILMTLLGREDEHSDLFSGIFTRHAASDSFRERASVQVQVLMALEDVPLGKGLGFTQAAEKAAGVDPGAGAKYETEPARVVVEIGLIGLIGTIMIRLVYLYQLWSASRSAEPGATSISTTVNWTSFWALLVYFLHGPSFNHISSTFVLTIAAVALGAATPVAVKANLRRAVPAAVERGLA